MARKKPQADNMKSKARKAAKAIVKKAVKKVVTKSAKKASKKTAKKASKKAVTKAVAKAAAKAPARKGAKKLAASTAKKARASVSKASAVKKVRAAKAARKAATRKTARKTARTPTSKAVTSAAPKRRAAPRSSAGRRLVGRASPSRETLAKKTLAAGGAKKAATKSTRKPAKKRAVKTAAPATALAVGKTARSRIVARQSKKLAPAVLRDGARRRVEKPTAPRPEKKPAARRPPFRLHALGVRDEHATDRPAVEALLVATYGRTDEMKALAEARAEGRVLCALVAEYEGELIGYLVFVKAEPFAILSAVAIAPQRQGKGVGSILVSAGIETARAAGAQAVVAPAEADWLLRFGFAPAPVFTQPRLALEIEPGVLAGEDGSRTPP